MIQRAIQCSSYSDDRILFDVILITVCFQKYRDILYKSNLCHFGCSVCNFQEISTDFYIHLNLHILRCFSLKAYSVLSIETLQKQVIESLFALVTISESDVSFNLFDLIS